MEDTPRSYITATASGHVTRTQILDPGDSSPWGEIDNVEQFKHNGLTIPLYFVTTSSHGGYMIQTGLFERLGLAEEIAHLNTFGGTHYNNQGIFYCFEEDCEWSLLVCELFRLGFGRLFNALGANETLLPLAKGCCRTHYPEYYNLYW